MTDITKDFPLLRGSGGLNEGEDPEDLERDEATKLENFIPRSGKLVRRDGVKRLTSTEFGQTGRSVFTYKDDNDVWHVVVGVGTGLAELSGTQLVQLPNAAGLSIATSIDPWDLLRYKGVGYAMRTGVGLLRFDATSVSRAGIAAPTTAFTMAEGAAGDLAAGDYEAVYTYYNLTTAAESNPSPSDTVTIGASKTIDYSAIGISSNPQVDARRIWRSTVDQSNEYFLMAVIANNFDTTYTGDNVLPLALGAAVSFDNGLPPGSLRYGAIWNERLWATDGIRLYYSERFLPEMFAEDSVLSVFEEDGNEIRAVRPFGARLIVGKTDKMVYVLNTGSRLFDYTILSDKHGCYSNWSLKTAEGIILWYGGDSFYRSDGETVHAVGDKKIEKILKRIPADRKKYVSAEIIPSLSLYIAAVTVDSGDSNNLVVVYDYKNDIWTTFTHPSGNGLQYITQAKSDDFENINYALMNDGHLYKYLSGTNDWGNAISAIWRTKAENFGRGGLRYALKRLYLQALQAAEVMDIKVYRDKSSTAYKTRQVTTDVAGWRVYSMNTQGSPASTLQVELVYEGDSPFEVDAMALEVSQYFRIGRAL